MLEEPKLQARSRETAPRVDLKPGKISALFIGQIGRNTRKHRDD
jgi:hypothetical protein